MVEFKKHSIDDEWQQFMQMQQNSNGSNGSNRDEFESDSSQLFAQEEINLTNRIAPEPTPIYISTKSKIAFITSTIDLEIFWHIPIILYTEPRNGVVKKQIKVNCKTPEELEAIQEKCRANEWAYCDQLIISHIDNPSGRIKFKDVRKISIGISKKDLTNGGCRKKQAFYNCFVLILRMKFDGIFREFHVKIFNTGKCEIPGVQSDAMFHEVLQYVISILQPFCETPLSYYEKTDTVLVNSNFNCNFNVQREKLYEILKYKYRIHAIYDACSYPGIQCKFYYKKGAPTQDGIMDENWPKENVLTISFMIFRTGSVLIVGMCEENMLMDIYCYLTKILKEEYSSICQLSASEISNGNENRNRNTNILLDNSVEEVVVKSRTKKMRKKYIYKET